VIVLAGCASSPPREKPPLTLDDVDVLSSGARDVLRVSGPIDLNNDPRIVCEERVPTGSHLSKVFCMTPAERAYLKQESEEELMEIRDAQQQFRESHPYNQ